jgi:hypothetical protein
MMKMDDDGGWILVEIFAGFIGVAAILVGIFVLVLLGLMLA